MMKTKKLFCFVVTAANISTAGAAVQDTCSLGIVNKRRGPNRMTLTDRTLPNISIITILKAVKLKEEFILFANNAKITLPLSIVLAASNISVSAAASRFITKAREQSMSYKKISAR
jgi:hypothetical protein